MRGWGAEDRNLYNCRKLKPYKQFHDQPQESTALAMSGNLKLLASWVCLTRIYKWVFLLVCLQTTQNDTLKQVQYPDLQIGVPSKRKPPVFAATPP